MANPRFGALLKPSEKSGNLRTPKMSTIVDKPASAKLTVSEQKKLRKLEAVIETPGLAVSYALRAIQEEKLYRQSFKTFEDYCSQRWGFTRQRAYQLLAALDVVDDLPPKTKQLLSTESQARALADVPQESRVDVLTEVAKRGAVTAKAITQIAQSNGHTAKKETKSVKDKIGCPIPADVLTDWREAEAFDDLLKQVHRIKLRIDKALDEKELAFREITNSTVADLHNAWSALQGLIPYAVCPTCEGHNRKSCTLCRQRGFLSKFAYEHYVPKKARELREKLHASKS